MNATVGSPFDAVPFGQFVDDAKNDVIWEDIREIHRVVAAFRDAVPDDLRLEYWRTHWPIRRIPKDVVPTGGGVGWWELGNWYTGHWQRADTDLSIAGSSATFTFRPVNEREFPNLTDFPATFRTTLRFRVVSDSETLADRITSLQAFTDSEYERYVATVLWQAEPKSRPVFAAFNGIVESVWAASPTRYVVTMLATHNDDPNTYDKTLLTVSADATFTVLLADVVDESVFVPEYGVCVVDGVEEEDYVEVVSAIGVNARKGLLDAVAELPEQTWTRAWGYMVPKRERFYLPLAVDGGRHKFGLNPDGSVFYRTNNHYLRRCPGRDTERLEGDGDRLSVSFGLSKNPVERTILDGSLPIGITAWEQQAIRIEQTAYATTLEGAGTESEAPPGDAFGVLMMQFALKNLSERDAPVVLPIRFLCHGESEAVSLENGREVRVNGRLRATLDATGNGALSVDANGIAYRATLASKRAYTLTIRLPYVALNESELKALDRLDFDAELNAVARYWRRRLDVGMTLLTPEGMLNEFHRAHAGHLLINCEKEPESHRRFARVGSFGYAAFGNESCMMIVDLDRRGYHREARECLDAFLAYQGTVALPGDYSSHDGVLYGAHGYECGGYNQHHGWILWCLMEHYRFTRDREWLASVAPNVLAASDWIIRERERTLDRDRDRSRLDAVGAGLLPHGSLEDIGDWWQWLSTNLYSWRGLDAAGWGLAELGHPEAARIRDAADAYRSAILNAFGAAMRRSPVVRLRNGVCVPHFPSHVNRRGRSFGWICETLEGAIHLLITRILDANSREADWILRDYEDNLYISPHYGYTIEEYDRRWFDWGGFSLQACLLFGVEPFLYRDNVKHALRAAFNAIAAYYFPDTRMLTEHALVLGEWRGDHYKSSDEANATGWLRYLFVREEGDELLLGQAIPRDWMVPGKKAGVRNAATYFGPMSLLYTPDEEGITATLVAPTRNPPKGLRLRFRPPENRRVATVTVNGETWEDWDANWVRLPGDVGNATVRASYS
jgi:hypothetical protein